MTYAQARLIIWNYETYPKAKVNEAVLFILSRLSARPEDIQQACSIA